MLPCDALKALVHRLHSGRLDGTSALRSSFLQSATVLLCQRIACHYVQFGAFALLVHLFSQTNAEHALQPRFMLLRLSEGSGHHSFGAAPCTESLRQLFEVKA
eukprot:TRINITY_DN4331_c0_g1_i7.p1 TRINITY_DN4331_c0_g1~~TRINITY_DN4331_c0_g1_i7.p1  ORF type:complete len:103 (-),score=16.68 TRINITY_DN4331_c0_g1_i7:101-409(-)